MATWTLADAIRGVWRFPLWATLTYCLNTTDASCSWRVFLTFAFANIQLEPLIVLAFGVAGSFCSTLRRLFFSLLFPLLNKHSSLIHYGTLQYFLARHDPCHCTAQQGEPEL